MDDPPQIDHARSDDAIPEDHHRPSQIDLAHVITNSTKFDPRTGMDPWFFLLQTVLRNE